MWGPAARWFQDFEAARSHCGYAAHWLALASACDRDEDEDEDETP